MKRLFLAGVLGWAMSCAAGAGTAPIYVNTAGVFAGPGGPAPQIDATAFWNQADFTISNSVLNSVNLGLGLSSGAFFTQLPFQSLNTRFFTNDSTMSNPGGGFRFDFFTNNVRRKMNSWVNNGEIFGDPWVMVAATNLFSGGPINAGAAGLIRMDGRSVNLSRNSLRAGNPPGTFLSDGGTIGTNYFNPAGVTDIYWGTGTNGTLDGASAAQMFLGFPVGSIPNFNEPNPVSPTHQVQQFSFGQLFTNIVSVPISSVGRGGGGGGNFGLKDTAAWVYTNQLSATSTIVQVVFVTTNSTDPSMKADVRFQPAFSVIGGGGGGAGAATVYVHFTFDDFDILTGITEQQSVYLTDTSAVDTNLSTLQIFNGNTRRPANYTISRSIPFGLVNGGSVSSNTFFDNSLIFNNQNQSNVVTYGYSGYGAQFSSIATAGSGNTLTDPTNLPGRVEIYGDNVNLDLTSIRAESTVVIRANNLSSNHIANVDAPFLAYDLGTTQAVFLVSNLAPTTVTRLSGGLSVWTGIWNNAQTNLTTTNFIQFQVMIVNNDLQTVQPVILNELTLRGKNIVVTDFLTFGKSLKIDATGLYVTGSLTLPPGSAWADTNFPNLRNLTNDGVITIPGAASYEHNLTNRYDSFVNHGTNTAGAQNIYTTYFEDTRCLGSVTGPLVIDAVVANFLGEPTSIGPATVTNIFFVFTNGIFTRVTNIATVIVTNSIGAKLSSISDINIHAGAMVVSNSVFIAGAGTRLGTLIISATNRLVDGGPGSINEWSTSAGFQMSRKATTNDLLHTHITSRSARNQLVNHRWAGTDLGAVNAGFSNNMALGELSLDVSSNAVFRFDSVTGRQALYVDYIELLNYGSNFASVLTATTNITVYFANANVPAQKLDGAAGGRFRWVRTFTGPLSSTNITYPSGSNYTFNVALVTSRDLDSDGDGIVNAEDPTPIFVAEMVSLASAMAPEPDHAMLLSWHALAYAINTLEYRDQTNSDWQTLTNFVQGDFTDSVVVRDPILPARQRIYRVRIEP